MQTDQRARASTDRIRVDGMSLNAALERLDAIDAAAAARCEWRSLAPGRARAHAPGRVVRDVTSATANHDNAAIALACGCADLLTVTLDSFPDNVFWDLDTLIAVIWRGGLASAAPADDIAARCRHIADLMHLFGRHTPIRFRYLHDFSYGFDWTRWIRKPAPDRTGGPFDWPFLRYLDKRGHELLDLIAADDAKYPKLANGEVRNPFAFSREPADEIALHIDLAAHGEIPLEAWNINATPKCDRAYAEVRAARATELGLPGSPAER